MSEHTSISSGIAARYATALFELASADKALLALEQDVDALDGALAESEDLRRLISSPLYLRDDQERAIGAVAEKMGLGALTANTLRLMAEKRRLFVLLQFLDLLHSLIAEAKGEVTAEVTAAAELTEDQARALTETLEARIGKDIKLKTAVDASSIGGLVVKVGSKMIDTSIRTKLDALKNAMKEVG